MTQPRYSTKVVYYGGYPGSSGKPVAGRLSWRDGRLEFQPRDPGGPHLGFDRSRLCAVRSGRDIQVGASQVRLLIDVETENGKVATLKFEMRGILPKARRLQRWLALLAPICRGQKDNHV